MKINSHTENSHIFSDAKNSAPGVRQVWCLLLLQGDAWESQCMTVGPVYAKYVLFNI